MWIILIIIAVIVIIAIKAKNKPSDSDEVINAIASEVIGLLKNINEFALLPQWKDECGLVMIIPINDDGDMYRPNSNKLRISLLLHRDDEYYINLCSQNSNITSRFKLVKDESSTCPSFSYIATTFITFNSDYKYIMDILYEKVYAAFPDIQFEFDGSRICYDVRNLQ